MKFDRAKFFNGIRDFLKSQGKTLTQKRVDALEFLITQFEKTNWSIPQISYALATCYHETAHTFEPIYEIGQRSYFNKYEPGTRIGKNLGNTEKGDGYKFRGRGYVQLTGRANYERYGIQNSPDAALDPATAFRIMTDGMAKGRYTGKKLSDYISDTGKDYKNARKVINGLDKADLIARYAREFEQILRDSKTNSAAPSKPNSAPANSPNKEGEVDKPPIDSERPSSTQIAENIVNTGDKATPDNFVEQDKVVHAPAKEGATAQSVKVSIAGIVVPSFIVALIKSIQELVANGYLNAKEVGDTVLSFIFSHQKYVFLLIGLVILLLILKKAFKQVTLWLEIWVAADPNKHNVRVKPQ